MCVSPIRLTRDEEIEAFAVGNFDLLILSMIPLATKVGKKIARQLGYDTDDAKSLATMAVCQSVRKFDPTRNRRLSTFMWRCVSTFVRHEINRDIRGRVSVSASTPANGGNNDWSELNIPAREESPTLREEKKLYWQAIKELPERERMILERRRAGETFRDIAKNTGISSSRVGQVYTESIALLRSKLVM